MTTTPPAHRHCAFADVRCKSTGEYYCVVCNHSFGRNYRRLVQQHNPALLPVLDAQCMQRREKAR